MGRVENNLIRISESDDWIVDYDKGRGMYRVSYFQDNHFVDEYWFDAYEEREVNNKTVPKPVIRFDNCNHERSAGRCPNCNKIISFDFGLGDHPGNRKCYCSKCGQLCDFEDID